VGGSLPASAEIYHPDANAWTAAASVSVPLSGVAAALLPDGRVLVTGGADGGVESDATELYLP